MSYNNTNKQTKREDRTRLWTFVLYEESAPIEWRDILDELHIQWIESPWHEFDENPDLTKKKKHKHILLKFDGLKSYIQIKEITDKLNQPIPQKCNNAKGLVRYMIHLDNPEKFQYDKNGIIGHGGADVNEYFKATSTDRHVLIREMIKYIRENDVDELTDFMDYCSENEFEWFGLLCDNSAMIISMYIQSYRNKKKDKEKNKVNYISEVTGEVLKVSDTVDSRKIDNIDYLTDLNMKGE